MITLYLQHLSEEIEIPFGELSPSPLQIRASAKAYAKALALGEKWADGGWNTSIRYVVINYAWSGKEVVRSGNLSVKV